MSYIVSKSASLQADERLARIISQLREGHFDTPDAVVVLRELLRMFPQDAGTIRPILGRLQSDARKQAEKILLGRATMRSTYSTEAARERDEANVQRYKEALAAFRKGDAQPALRLAKADWDRVAANASRIQRASGRRPPFAMLGLRVNARLIDLLHTSFGE